MAATSAAIITYCCHTCHAVTHRSLGKLDYIAVLGDNLLMRLEETDRHCSDLPQGLPDVMSVPSCVPLNAILAWSGRVIIRRSARFEFSSTLPSSPSLCVTPLFLCRVSACHGGKWGSSIARSVWSLGRYIQHKFVSIEHDKASRYGQY